MTPADRIRVCAKCGTKVYFDNGMVTFACLCGESGWKWMDVLTPKLGISSSVDGMVSLEDVEKAIRVDFSEGHIASADREVSRILSHLACLTKPKTPEPTVTLLDPTGGPSMEVPSSAVQPMGYHLANQKSTICKECGSLVGNMGRHNLWHKEKEPSK